MWRAVTILSLGLAGSAFAHSDSKWTKGPQGGHIVDAGGKQHWELVAKGNELVLYVLDANEKPAIMLTVAAPRDRSCSPARPITSTSSRRAATC